MNETYDTAELRKTAAAWHGGQGSPLYAYASSGTVVSGVDREIRECLDLVERAGLSPEIDFDLDRVDEHDRLLELLRHVEPELAKIRAGEIGHQHGQAAVAWWHQDILGGRATGNTTAVARRILQGIEDGDPAILDHLPTATTEDYSEVDLEGDCDWIEPSPDDRGAHDRWSAARSDLWDAYQEAFDDAVHDGVTIACQDALDEALLAADPTPGADQEIEPQPTTEVTHRHLAQACYSGAWAAAAEAPALAMSLAEARAIAFRGERLFKPPSPSPSRIPPSPGGVVVPPVDLEDATTEHITAIGAEAAAAWESGRDALWPAAVRATALRRLGLSEPAEFLERMCHDRLQALAEAVRTNPIPEPARPHVRPAEPVAAGHAHDDIPAGWVAEPIGRWGLRECEVVYNPRRFDITVTRSPGGLTPAAIEAEKWQWLATDGGRALWARDGIEAARDTLANLEQRAAGVEPGKPGQAVQAPTPGLAR